VCIVSCNACANFMNVRSQNGCLYLDGYIDEHTVVISVVEQHTSWLLTCKYTLSMSVIYVAMCCH